MSTLEERQVELEIESIVMGRQRYERRREEEGESATSPGAEQTKRAVPALAAAIEAFVVDAATPGRAGRKHSCLPFLVNVDPVESAYLTVRYALDGAVNHTKVNTVALNLGCALQDHINITSMADGEDTADKKEKQHMKRLFRRVLDQVKKATTDSHRKGVWHTVLKRYRPGALDWTDKNKLLVGLKLIELFEASGNLVHLRRDTDGRNDTPIRIVLTAEAEEWFADAHMRSSLWEPVHQPMLVPPRDWTSPFSGGYLTSAIRGANMVLSHSRGYLDELKNIDMPLVYSAVNVVQSTPWRVNSSVLAVMREAWTLGPKFKALFFEQADPSPPRPAGIPEGVSLDTLPPAQKEEIMAWKRKRALAIAAKNREKSVMGSAINKLAVATKFKDEEAVFFPHYLDFRGRIYPFASYLNPQGDDVARGLLGFAVGKPLGARGAFWLKVHLANLFGVDKVSFENRVKWVDEHVDDLMGSAMSPLDCDFWMTADSPWQALAACFEYTGWIVQGDAYVSHLPIAMDGSCSGLQHYSAMLRDEEGGRQVNLVPSAKPADIYTAVALRVQSRVDAFTCEEASPWKGGKVVRKIAKQPTMTYCYSATQYGMAHQIEDAVRKHGKEYLGAGVDVRPAAVYMAGLVRQAIGETVVAAATAMTFLQEIATLAAEKGLPIYWTAPSGFLVVQEYKQPVGQRVEVMYGGVMMKLTIHKDGSNIDKKRQAAGVAPNFVHACDSAHLMATVNLGVENGLQDWACIHDSFGVHAADVDTLHACIRESFIEQYTPDVLQRFRDEIIEQLQSTAPELIEKVPAVPAQGSLDLAGVRESAYFFA